MISINVYYFLFSSLITDQIIERKYIFTLDLVNECQICRKLDHSHIGKLKKTNIRRLAFNTVNYLQFVANIRSLA